MKKWFLSILLPLGVGGLAGFLTRDSMAVYSQVRQPPLAPPGWVFPVVWTILYLLMGTAAYWAGESPGSGKGQGRLAYGVQLALNFFWPILFFRLQWFGVSFLWLLLLLAAIGWTMAAFSRTSRRAAKLLIPYFLWTLFAGYLNLGIYLLNR